MRTPLTVMAVLFAILLGIALATEDEEGAAGRPSSAPVDVIARRVEALRDLRFDRLPIPVEVDSEQARREGLEDFDREYPPERLRAEQELYEMLGLIEPGADLRALSGELFGEGVAGYYDPRDGRLRVVTGAGTGTRVLAEMVLAHELTHALEDQRFGIDVDTDVGDDRALAEAALREGTATAVMYAYVQRHFTTEETLGALLGAAFQDTGDLPPFVEAQAVFPYVGGQAFVDELLRRAGGRWALVDTAYRLRPPSSTEQVLHPAAYFEADEPEPVTIPNVPGWERVSAGTWGELQTREMLARAGGGAEEAAAGWGGDRYELWRSPRGSALIMRWQWDTPRDEAEFALRLRDFANGLDRPAAVARRGGAVTLAIAPDAGLARRLAESP
jgi:hypothetical protein